MIVVHKIIISFQILVSNAKEIVLNVEMPLNVYLVKKAHIFIIINAIQHVQLDLQQMIRI